MNNKTEWYIYVLVRQDLKPEHQMVQACHAAVQAGFAFKEPDSIASLVLCHVPNEEALLQAKYTLETKGIDTYIFEEPCWDMGFSALASAPVTEARHRRAFAKYPLAKLQP